MTRSISYHKDSRRNSNIEGNYVKQLSICNFILGPPSGHRGQRSVINKHMTHDGRTAERRKLSPEEVNPIKPDDVSKDYTNETPLRKILGIS